MDFLIGFALALAIAAVAFRLRSLSRSGAAAAVALGTVVYGLGGAGAALILITFFVSSSLLGRITTNRRDASATEYAKGAERDAGQVLGNGIVAAGLAVAISANPLELWPWLGYAGAVAAVNADTWATEIGALSRSSPVLITRPLQPVLPGTSGGVTLLGSLAALVGAALIASLAAIVRPGPTIAPAMILPVTLAGLVAALIDSLLGATVQAMYRCSRDGTETEQHPLHKCGAETKLVRGWPWLNNDRVNLACSLCGASLAVALGALFGLV